jgi:alpha/beta superfamily hydrolase
MPEVMFAGPDGRLEGRYHHSKETGAPLALIMHPHPLHGGTMNNRVAYTMYQSFQKLGFSVMRFNFRGVGRSQGRYDGGIGEISDAAAALDWMQAVNPNHGGLWISGYSFGAFVGMQLLMRRPEVSGWVSVAPPANHCAKHARAIRQTTFGRRFRRGICSRAFRNSWANGGMRSCSLPPNHTINVVCGVLPALRLERCLRHHCICPLQSSQMISSPPPSGSGWGSTSPSGFASIGIHVLEKSAAFPFLSTTPSLVHVVLHSTVATIAKLKHGRTFSRKQAAPSGAKSMSPSLTSRTGTPSSTCRSSASPNSTASTSTRL